LADVCNSDKRRITLARAAANIVRNTEWTEKGVELTQGEAVAILLRY
jgi:hypothetical protein